MILLENRGVIIMAGADARKFLQGMITNNIDKLTPQKPLYTALLTAQGKYLFDFIIYEQDELLLLDIEKTRVDELVKKLNMYKLRADVKISHAPEYKVYWDKHDGHEDPRHSGLGRRLLTTEEKKADGSFADYEHLRISLGVPDSHDFIPDKTFILQNNFEQLNGVDFNKGCYVGQEVTARTKYRDMIKKAIFRVEGNALPGFGVEIKAGGKVIGEMRSTSGNIGLAELNIEEAFKVFSYSPISNKKELSVSLRIN